MPPSDPLDLLLGCAAAIRGAIARCDDWASPAARPEQYAVDLAADEAAVGFLEREGVAVLSEESGPRGRADADLTVVIDPIDGSTNAVRRLPMFASSLAALDAEGPVASVVDHLARPERYTAERGAGARCNGEIIHPSGCQHLGDATVALCGPPPPTAPWPRMRAWGAASLELCAVATGAFDAFVNLLDDYHGPWDYLGAWLVCTTPIAPFTASPKAWVTNG